MWVSCFKTLLVWGKCPFGAMLTSSTLLTYSCKQTRIKHTSKWNVCNQTKICLSGKKLNFEEQKKFWRRNKGQFQSFGRGQRSPVLPNPSIAQVVETKSWESFQLRLYLMLTASAAAAKSLSPTTPLPTLLLHLNLKEKWRVSQTNSIIVCLVLTALLTLHRRKKCCCIPIDIANKKVVSSQWRLQEKKIISFQLTGDACHLLHILAIDRSWQRDILSPKHGKTR